MARKDQPYLPLYVQDFMTDEKLMECSAAATGVYIRIMCILHKSQPYGTVLLKQKYKQTNKQYVNFATMFAKFLPYDKEVILEAISELLHEGCLTIEGDLLYQKRMRDDGVLSDQRSLAGKNGAEIKKKFAEAKPQANADIDIDNDNTGNSLFNTMPIAKNFNGLPEIKIGSVIELFKITKQTDISSEQVSGLWNVFKIQNLTGKKYYANEDEVYSHFINWSKNQKIEKNGADKKSTGTTKFNAGANELLDRLKKQATPK
jgi:hypothetical protein